MSQAIDEGRAELTVRGRLGHRGAAELDAAFGSLPEGIATVLLDLGGVDYVSSPGLRLLASRATELEERGGGLSVRHASDSVRLALDLAGLERLHVEHDSGEP